jgi:hypothetical protein
MWMHVVIVALLLGVGALLNRADWRTRFLTRVRTAGSPWAKAAHDAVTRVRPKRVAGERVARGQEPAVGDDLLPERAAGR